MVNLRLIVTGTGRCGTGYASRLLSGVGLLTGHEHFFSYAGLVEARRRLRQEQKPFLGDASWMAVPFLGEPELAGAFIVHLVRHPKAVLESWLRVPTATTPPYDAFYHRHVPMAHAYDGVLDKSALRYVLWNEWIERACRGRPSVRHRLEDGPMALFEAMQDAGMIDRLPAEDGLFSDTSYNHKEGQPVEVDPDDVNFMLSARLRAITMRYGYEWDGFA